MQTVTRLMPRDPMGVEVVTYAVCRCEYIPFDEGSMCNNCGGAVPTKYEQKYSTEELRNE